MKSNRRNSPGLRASVVKIVCILLYATTAHAFSTGIATTSFPVPAQGCNLCHTGGLTPVITLECVDCGGGPPEVDPLSVHEFKLTVAETGFQDHAGLNVSSATGTLSLGGSFSLNTQTIVGTGGRDEITHNAPKPAAAGFIEFSFLWTAPAGNGVATLGAWGNNVNFNSNTGGDAANFFALDVGVGQPPPTPTPTEPPGEVEPYLSYKIRAQKQDPSGTPIPANIFPKDWVITANDVRIDDMDADDPENFVVKKPKELLNVVEKNGVPPADTESHYVRYDMSLGKESVQPAGPDGEFPKPPKHIARIWQLDNDFGTIKVASKKVKGLLVPAAASPISSPSAPADATHYACYQVKATADITAQTPDKGDGTGKFRSDMQVFLSDEFFDDCALLEDGVTPSFAGTEVEGACLFNLKKAVELCNPIDKSAVVPPRETSAVIDGSVAATTQSLLCYRVSLATKFTYGPAAALADTTVGTVLDPKQTKHVKRGQKTGNPVHTTAGNQFPGPVEVDTSKQYVACLPTDVTGFSPAP